MPTQYVSKGQLLKRAKRAKGEREYQMRREWAGLWSFDDTLVQHGIEAVRQIEASLKQAIRVPKELLA